MVASTYSTERLEAALRIRQLNDLADTMRVEGITQSQAEEVFSKFHLHLLNQGREADADVVAESLELITGNCHPCARLFPPNRYKPFPGLLKFFASPEDRPKILSFILTNTGFQVFRQSAPDCSRMRIEDLSDYVPEVDKRLCLWNSCLGLPYEILAPAEYPRYQFRSDPAFSLSFGDVMDKSIAVSGHHWGFRREEPSAGALTLLEPLREFILEHSTASAIGVPVLSGAMKLVHQGYVLKEAFSTRWTYEID